MLVLFYYSFSNPPVKLSKFLQLSNDDRNKILLNLNKENQKLVEIICFCLMPNHFHLLLKQVADKGISRFLSKLQNSYTRYFNTKNERVGPLFLDQFKAVIIRTEEQLLHVSRYIHLNPLTSYVVKDFDSLRKYPWSSLEEYLTGNIKICSPEIILNYFKKKKSYEKFVQDQISYQQQLDRIKHMILE